MQISLFGRVALVTGAAQGVGKGIALELARSGAMVAVSDIDDKVIETKEEIEKMAGKAVAVIFDVADSAAVEAGVREVKEKLGPVDILVNNAGITYNVSSLLKMTREKWDWEIGINLGGAFNCTKAVLPDMVEAKWGRIIMISSISAPFGAHFQAAYASSKAAMGALGKTIAQEHSRDGITCNILLCSMLATPRVQTLPEEIMGEYLNKRTPIGRIGKVEEVGYTVVFLASEQASYITGAELHVDGGAHLCPFSVGVRNLRFSPQA